MGLADFFRRRSVAPSGLPNPQPCDFVAIDFETANETRGSACSVGIAQVRDGQVVAEGATLINPETYFNPYCTAVNGIDEDDVRTAPTFSDLWPELSAVLDGQTVVAHNASFDMSVMRNTAARYEVAGGPEFDLFCTYRMARVTWPEMPSFSLGYVAPAIGVTFEHHEAGNDARACALVALAVCRTLAVLALADAAAELKFVPGRMTATSYQGFHLAEYAAGLHAMDGNADADPEHPLYGKSVCFTGGMLSMVRRDAAARVVDVGGDFKNSVSKKLDYLVIGDADFVQFADGHRTGKLDKAITLRDAGAPIEIIPENDFLQLLLS
jgi:DNA polymerase-3 subunit epsilon